MKVYRSPRPPTRKSAQPFLAGRGIVAFLGNSIHFVCAHSHLAVLLSPFLLEGQFFPPALFLPCFHLPPAPSHRRRRHSTRLPCPRIACHRSTHARKPGDGSMPCDTRSSNLRTLAHFYPFSFDRSTNDHSAIFFCFTDLQKTRGGPLRFSRSVPKWNAARPFPPLFLLHSHSIGHPPRRQKFSAAEFLLA